MGALCNLRKLQAYLKRKLRNYFNTLICSSMILIKEQKSQSNIPCKILQIWFEIPMVRIQLFSSGKNLKDNSQLH